MELLEFLLEILLDLVGNGLIELLLEYPFSDYKEKRNRKNHSPVLAVPGYLLLGSIVGACVAWAFPRRFLSFTGIPGLSLLLSPLGAGLLMHWWGRRRRASGHSTTNLATWYGGAAFAFGAAATRYLLVS